MSSKTEQPPRAPLSTYRFQFNLHFTFRQATDLIPYLHALGVTDLYASPYLRARPGSLHGYDISDHRSLNPEIGTPEDHTRLTVALRRHDMGHLLDIVPNHMGIGQASNRWWMDVLENGQSSPFAPYFDIDWDPLKPELAGKVLLPVLGDQFGRVLEAGELKLAYEEGRFRLYYFEHQYPVSPRSASLVLRETLDRMSERLDPDQDQDDFIELQSIVTALENLPARTRTDRASVTVRRREGLVSRRRLSALHEGSEPFRAALDGALQHFNGTPGEPHSFDPLERLLDDQPYRLAYWRVAAEEINYRRFFDINDLAGLRVERPEVFDAAHELVLQFVREGKVTGLRIDHPDGLFDPPGYLEELQRRIKHLLPEAAPFYVVVEKILTGDERLPDDWQVAGTVGYEFLNRLNGLFVDGRNERRMTEVYDRFLGRAIDFHELVYAKKKLILRVALASELSVLAWQLDRLCDSNRRFRDFTLGSLTDALRETIACFPVYRTYVDARSGSLDERDRQVVERALRTAVRRNRATSPTLFEFIGNILLLRWPDDLTPEQREDHAAFVMKFQQLTGPVMAKGLEDTSFYIYNRLVSLNEVGGEPDRFGVPPAEWHAWAAERCERWPLALNTTSTHDTKRSEDVRARIDVLSEMPDAWEARVQRWAEMNAPLRPEHDDDRVPDRNDEYLLYQTLVGAWPLGEPDEADRAAFVERVQQYMEKATREAKLHTSWINPNEEYDQGLREFVAAVLGNGPFLEDFVAFQREVAYPGMLNALSQTLLKLTAPGVPDVYQGQEVWDFSLVDPDNRRPVDWGLRARLLQEIEEATEAGGDPVGELARSALDSWVDGRVKLLVTRAALRLRRAEPELFRRGSYVPLEVVGERAEHVVAFARVHEGRAVMVAAPRLWRTLLGGEGRRYDPAAWAGTRLRVPGSLPPGPYRELLAGGEVRLGGAGETTELPMEQLLSRFPIALLAG